MVLVLCANAGVDRAYEVANFAAGQHHTARGFRVVAGGKGINVARALRAFDVETVVTGFAGGLGARFVQQQMLSVGVQPFFVPIAEESRVCINIVDPTAKTQTRVDEAGPLVTPSEVSSLERRWARLLERARVAVIAGSVPRGVSLDLYAELITTARRAKVPVLLDARDELLSRALAAKPLVIKPNLEELARLLGQPVAVPQGVLQAAEELIAGGIRAVVVTLGAQGAIGVTAGQERYWVKPPKVEAVSDVGSGDAMMAGLAAALVSRKPFAEQLRWGTAAGAANAATFGPCMFDSALLQQHLAGVTLVALTPQGKPAEQEVEHARAPEEWPDESQHEQPHGPT